MMLALLFAAIVAASPVKLTPAQEGELVRGIMRHRLAYERWLQKDSTSYLATVGRRDFGSRKTLTVGAAPDNDLQLAGEGIRPHHLRVTVMGDGFEVTTVDPQATFRYRNANVREAQMLLGSIQVGRYRLVLSNQHFPAIIVQDPKSPRFQNYKGVRFFPVDPSDRFVLPLRLNPKPEREVILSTRGDRRQALRVGWFDFLVHGRRCRLEVNRLLEPGVGEDDLMVLFRDATTGKESYPVGRYVDPKRLADGRYLLDFNGAYNPACAYSPDYNCPLPPRANTLKVAIRAGEMDSHYSH